MLAKAPVSIAEGVYLSDDNARSFARHMLAELKGYEDRSLAMMDANDPKDRRASLGNPKGQRRYFRRLVEAMGPTHIYSGLRAGNRCKFLLVLFQYVVHEGNLAIYSSKAEGVGPSKPLVWAVQRCLTFTPHSLQRLIQRSQVREAKDYIYILQDMLDPMLRMVMAMRDGAMQEGETWPVPVTVNNQRVILLVRFDPEAGSAIVVSVLKGSWRDSAALTALAQMLADPLLPVERAHELSVAFRAAAPGFQGAKEIE